MKALYIILALTLVLLIALVVVWLYQRKKAKAAAAESEEPAGPGGDEISLLFHEAEAKLSAAKLAQGARIGNLPVYLLMGDPGSTKTSVMLHSGLEAELVAGQVYESSNVVPTRTANLWFSRRSIFLEAGGTLPGDSAKWKGLVKKLRPRASVVGKGEQAPRAAVVFFDCENFARQGAGDFVVAAGRTLRARLVEISQALGINMPVYVIFSKMDRLPFFTEFVHNLSTEEATQVVGVTLPMLTGRSEGVYAEQETARLNWDFERLFHSLADARPELLARENDETKLPGAYEFPREFRKLRPALVQFLVDLCRPSVLTVGPFLRGFYFTGVRPVVINESAPISAAASQQQQPGGYGTASDATGIFRMGTAPQQAQQAAPAPQITGTRKVPQWLFLTHLFNDILLADNAAMGSSGASIKTSFARRLLLGIAAGLCFVAALGFTVSFFKNRALEAEVRDAAVGIPPVQLAATDLAPVDHLRKLETLRQSLEWLSYYRREGAPWGYRWLLYVGDDLYPDARRIYFDRFRQLLFAQTQGGIVRSLKGLPPAPGPGTPDYQPTYDALKAYLITTSNPDKSTREFLPPVLMTWWKNNRTVDAERSQLARKQFDYYENELHEANPFSKENDAPAVDKSRRYLAQFAGTERVYAFMLAEAGKNNPPVNFNRQFAGSAQAVLQPYEVPGAFSKGGWAFMKDAIPNADKFFSGEKWVLGDQASANIDRSKLEHDLRARYNDDFIKHWRTYIKSAGVVRFSLKEAPERLTQLSGVQSPLLELLGLASVHTAVDDPAVAKVFQPVQAVVPPGNLDRFILPPNQNYMGALAALQAAIEPVAGKDVVDEAAAAPGLASAQQAKLSVRQIAQGFVIDAEGHIEASTQKLLIDPILYVEGILRPSPDTLNAKGAGLCREFRAVMAKYPFKSDAKIEATVGDVNRLFRSPDGELWIFYNNDLKKMLPKQGGQYVSTPAGGLALTPSFVAFFSAVAAFAETLYPNGAQDPTFKYTLKPYPSNVFQKGTLKIDAQEMSYSASALAPKQFIWQGIGAHGEVATVNFGGPDLTWSSNEGLWSVFRFFSEARLKQAGTAQLLEWVVTVNGKPMTTPDGKPVTVQFDLDMGGAPPVFQKGWFSRLGCVAEVASAK